MHAADGVELGHEQSPRSLIATPCGEQHETGPPLLGLDLVGADAGLGVRADLRDDVARLVEDRDAAAELADDGVVAIDGDGGRQQQVLGDDAEELAVERQVDDAVVGAVAGDDARRLEARVDRELVQRVEVVGRLLAAERLQVLARCGRSDGCSRWRSRR